MEEVFVFMRTALKSSSKAFPAVAKQEFWVNTSMSQLQRHLHFPNLSENMKLRKSPYTGSQIAVECKIGNAHHPPNPHPHISSLKEVWDFPHWVGRLCLRCRLCGQRVVHKPFPDWS